MLCLVQDNREPLLANRDEWQRVVRHAQAVLQKGKERVQRCGRSVAEE
jgi:hypothetical protein